MSGVKDKNKTQRSHKTISQRKTLKNFSPPQKKLEVLKKRELEEEKAQTARAKKEAM